MYLTFRYRDWSTLVYFMLFLYIVAWSKKHCPDWSEHGRALGTYLLVQTYNRYQTPHIATNKSSAMSYCASKFFVAESISKETPHIFVPKRWNRFFAIYVVRLALYVCLKNICDGVGCQNGWNTVPLSTPLFFGWTISLNGSTYSVVSTQPC